MRALLLTPLAMTMGLVASLALADWPEFRGPRQDGSADAQHLPTTWNALRNIAWQTEIPGRGWSSPVVTGNRIWLTTAESRALTDEQRQKKVAQSKYKEYEFQTFAAVTLLACELDEITGPGSSPILWRNLMIFPCDGTNAQIVVAVDQETGRDVWRAPRPKIDLPEPKHHRAFSTPLIVRHDGRDQVVIPGAQWVVSYDPATGAERWRVNFGDGHAIVPRPVDRAGVVYICTGYWKPKMWAIRVDGAGDVTDTHVAWKFDKQVPEIASPIVVGDEIYFVSTIGVASCLDATSGDLLWQHRLGGNFGASPLAAGDKIYFTSEEGTTTVVRAGREYQELARNRLNGLILASPAVYENAILWRNSESLICVRATTPAKP